MGIWAPKIQFFANISLSMHFYGKTREWRIVPRKISYRIMYSKLSLDCIVSIQRCPKYAYFVKKKKKKPVSHKSPTQFAFLDKKNIK